MRTRVSAARSAPLTLILCVAAAAVAAAGLPHRAAAASTATLATADTSVRIQAEEGRVALVSLRNRGNGWDWIPARGTDIPLISAAEVGGQTMPLAWRLVGLRQERSKDARAIFTFACRDPALELRSVWSAAAGPGPVEHTIEIANRGTQPVLLPMQTTLQFDSRALGDGALESWWVEKGAGHPSDVGTHHDAIAPGFQRTLVSTPYADDGEPREAIPWIAVQDEKSQRGWYAGIEFSGRVKLALDALPSATTGSGVGVHAAMGLDAAAGDRTRLRPGETWEAPTVFVGCYAGGVDDGANRLHRWVESVLRPPVPDPHYPLLTLNSWGTGMGVDAGLAHRMADDAASLGLEMLHIDAGWFRGVGDWRPDPAKFPQGLAAISDYAHSKGLKFGLWVGWTQGGNHPDAEDRQVILNVHAPDRKDWFTHDYPPDWQPSAFTGADLCLSDPAAYDWCLGLLDRLVREYRLDMLEHDQRMIVDRCDRSDHPHTAAPVDVAYRAAQGYYHVYDALRERHPGLLFEDCVNGGRTVDYGIARRVHYVSITDTYSPLANRRAFYDASYALPPSMCECYIQNEPVRTADEFRTMLRSGMMGWCTIMCDTTQWAPEQHAIARRQFELYRTRLRPLINRGSLYHVSERPDGVRWDGMEYVDTARQNAVLFAFRGSTPEDTHLFSLRGLRPNAAYELSFEDGSLPSIQASGRALMTDGIRISLAEPGSSQIVLLRRK